MARFRRNIASIMPAHVIPDFHYGSAMRQYNA
jgi:hypothetical protein